MTIRVIIITIGIFRTMTIVIIVNNMKSIFFFLLLLPCSL